MNFSCKCIIFWMANAGQPDGWVSGVWLNEIWAEYVDRTEQTRPRLKGSTWTNSPRYRELHPIIARDLAAMVEYKGRTGAFNLQNAGCVVGLGVFKTFDEWYDLRHAFGFYYKLTDQGWKTARSIEDSDSFYEQYLKIFPDGSEFHLHPQVDESGVLRR